uniref:MORN repeat-containing protein 5 n=1 Tax=Haptolina ericina TaxID=156174 RepID=A0A7S3EPL6_9EUKA|mmetsp:Transcript_10739/g.24705  ORF Transcript_10739/g.24705 Transcript_10739/m.24705 type:complete len:178 (+) Transcript_10739:19-552(+)
MAAVDKPSDLPHYDGPRKNGRMEGYATYTFPSGTIYTGQFLDGEFHGEGTLQFPDSGKYEATWRHGKAVRGRYVFSDGLPYTEPADGEWEYCREDGDRRFYSELVNGLRPAGDSQLSNAHPPPVLPLNTYDVGDGYMDTEGDVRPYPVFGEDSEELAPIRQVDAGELKWAIDHCRKG